MTRIDSQQLLNALFRAIRIVSERVKDCSALKILNIDELDFLDLPTDELVSMLTYAYVNKVLSLLIIKEPNHGTLRSLRERVIHQRKKFLVHLKSVVSALDECHVEYVIFKTLRPVPETPVDIDVLVPNKWDAYRVVQHFKNRFGVEKCGEDKYSIGIRIPQFKEFLDFYVAPHVADFVYLDIKSIISNSAYLHIDDLGVEIQVPVPKPELEFCSVLAHSIVKEGLVTLNDVVSLMAYRLLSSDDELGKWLSLFSLSVVYGEYIKLLRKNFPARIDYLNRFSVLASLVRKRYAALSMPYFMLKLSRRLDRVVEQKKKVTYARGFGR